MLRVVWLFPFCHISVRKAGFLEFYGTFSSAKSLNDISCFCSPKFLSLVEIWIYITFVLLKFLNDSTFSRPTPLNFSPCSTFIDHLVINLPFDMDLLNCHLSRSMMSHPWTDHVNWVNYANSMLWVIQSLAWDQFQEEHFYCHSHCLWYCAGILWLYIYTLYHVLLLTYSCFLFTTMGNLFWCYYIDTCMYGINRFSPFGSSLFTYNFRETR